MNRYYLGSNGSSFVGPEEGAGYGVVPEKARPGAPVKVVQVKPAKVPGFVGPPVPPGYMPVQKLPTGVSTVNQVIGKFASSGAAPTGSSTTISIKIELDDLRRKREELKRALQRASTRRYSAEESIETAEQQGAQYRNLAAKIEELTQRERVLDQQLTVARAEKPRSLETQVGEPVYESAVDQAFEAGSKSLAEVGFDLPAPAFGPYEFGPSGEIPGLSVSDRVRFEEDIRAREAMERSPALPVPDLYVSAGPLRPMEAEVIDVSHDVPELPLDVKAKSYREIEALRLEERRRDWEEARPQVLATLKKQERAEQSERNKRINALISDPSLRDEAERGGTTLTEPFVIPLAVRELERKVPGLVVTPEQEHDLRIAYRIAGADGLKAVASGIGIRGGIAALWRSTPEVSTQGIERSVEMVGEAVSYGKPAVREARSAFARGNEALNNAFGWAGGVRSRFEAEVQAIGEASSKKQEELKVFALKKFEMATPAGIVFDTRVVIPTDIATKEDVPAGPMHREVLKAQRLLQGSYNLDQMLDPGKRSIVFRLMGLDPRGVPAGMLSNYFDMYGPRIRYDFSVMRTDPRPFMFVSHARDASEAIESIRNDLRASGEKVGAAWGVAEHFFGPLGPKLVVEAE